MKRKIFFIFSAFLFFIPLFSFALYFENFDKYDSGVYLRDADSKHWEGNLRVTNATSFSHPNSITGGGNLKNVFDFSTSTGGGIISFLHNPLVVSSGVTALTLRALNEDLPNESIFGAYFRPRDGILFVNYNTCLGHNYHSRSFSIPAYSGAGWTDISVEFKIYNERLYFRFIVRGQATDFITNDRCNFRWHRVNKLHIHITGYLDDLLIKSERDRTISENCFNTSAYLDKNFFLSIFNTIRQFNPPYPNRLYYVLPTSTSIFFKATAINSSILFNIYKLEKIILKSRKTGNITEIPISGNWLPQGTFEFNQDITNELLNAFSGDDDALEMKILVKRKNLLTTGMVADDLYFPIECAPPIILVLNENSPYIVVEIPSEHTPPDYLIPLQNCDDSNLNFLEKITCEIRNLLITLFVPKKSTLNELVARKDMLANKFPFNVFASFKNFFFDVYNSLRNPEVQIQMFGKTIKINPQTYQNLPVISSLFAIIRVFFDIILIFFAIKVLRFEIQNLLKAI